jgi:hypothetical protein
MVVDRMQGLRLSLPFCLSVCLSVFASVVCIFACVFVRLFVRLSTGKMIETGWGWGAGGVAKNHALVEAFYYRT